MKKPIKYVLVLILGFIICFFVYGYAKDNFDLTTNKTEFIKVERVDMHLYIDYELKDEHVITKETIFMFGDGDEDFTRKDITINIIYTIGSYRILKVVDVNSYVYNETFYVKVNDVKQYLDDLRGELWITNLPSIHAIKSW